MVHRPSDGRLLTNLVSQEKEYSKQFSALFDASHVSLALFEAYAAASPPPASHFILAAVRALANAEEALRKYAVALNSSREPLKALSTLEDYVANMVRDREILVTRLIKASKSQKHASLTSSPFGSASSLSYSPKLAAAQTELQACEAQLAAKERDLDARRSTAVREALAARCRAMVECGTAWTECGNSALRSLDSWSLGSPNSAVLANSQHKPLPAPASLPHAPDRPSSLRSASQLSVSHLSTSSLSPSQSASQVNEQAHHAEVPPSGTGIGPDDASHHIYSNVDLLDVGTPSASHDHSTATSYGEPVGQPSSFYSPATSPPPKSPEPHPTLHIPPAHAISDLAMPTSSPAINPATEVPLSPSTTSLPVTPTSRHYLPRRITEETLHTMATPAAYGADDAGGSSEDEQGAESANVQVVENPRFARAKSPGIFSSSHTSVDIAAHSSSPSPTRRRAFSSLLRGHGGPTPNGAPNGAPNIPESLRGTPSPTRKRKTSLFGSIRGLFGSSNSALGSSHTGSPLQDRDAVVKETSKGRHDTDDERPAYSPERQKSTRKRKGGWETRTDRNLRTMRIGADANSSDSETEDKRQGKQGNRHDATDTGSENGLPSSSKPAVHASSPLQQLHQEMNNQSNVTPQAFGTLNAASSSSVGLSPGGSTKRESGNRLKKHRSINKVKEKKAKGKAKENGAAPQTLLLDNTGGLVDEPHPMPSDDSRRPHSTIQSSPGSNGQNNIGRRGNSLDGPPPGTGTVRRRSLTKPKSTPSPTAASHALTDTEPSLAQHLQRNDVNISRRASLRSTASSPTRTTSKRGSYQLTGSGMHVSPIPENPGSRPGTRERRWSGSHVPSASASGSGEGGLSLMSIVENVARANRDGWATADTPTPSPQGTLARSVGGSAKPVGLLEIVKAPPSVGRKELESTSSVAALIDRGAGSGMSVPSAPLSVFSHPHAGDVALPSAKAEASASGAQGASPPSSVVHRPAKSPLKSAMRNSSRTPSPMPGIANVIDGLPFNTSTPHSSSPRASEDAPNVAPAAGNRPEAMHSKPNGARPSSSGSKGKGKARRSLDANDSDSGASISSYETGHEVFASEDEDTEKELPASHAPKPAAVQPQSQPRTNATQETSGSSTVGSGSTASMGSSAVASDGTDNTVQRRKSVRVSLHPTFSPTPPAIEEDDSPPAPWGAAPTNGWTNGEAVRDMWEDSSDEDVEYQKAKRLLARLSKKAHQHK